MPRSPARFTQAEVTRLLKAAKGTEFECITIEVLPGSKGLRATYSTAAPTRQIQQHSGSSLEKWRAARATRSGALGSTSHRTKLAPSGLSNREREALKQLFDSKERAVRLGETPGAGLATQMALEKRGFVVIERNGGKLSSWRISQTRIAFVEGGGLSPASNRRDVL